MRPVIGLTHSIQLDEKKLYMPMSYSNVIREAGGTPVLLPINREDEVIEALKKAGYGKLDKRNDGEWTAIACQRD